MHEYNVFVHFGYFVYSEKLYSMCLSNSKSYIIIKIDLWKEQFWYSYLAWPNESIVFLLQRLKNIFFCRDAEIFNLRLFA